MLTRFTEFIKKYSLFQPDQKILLAVSGGIDSVAMTSLFQQAGYDFAIAHCNFHLRDKESDDDQEFIRALSVKYNKTFYTTDFNTQACSSQRNISIQMAARELRYEWFNTLLVEKGYDKIAIAHNRDDIAETFIINIVRGTGLNGLTGIKPVQNKIIRPVLFASRAEISSYVESNALNYREDSSNAEIKYQRNLIRHKIIPLLKEINPSVTETIVQEIEIFNSTNILYQKEIDKIRKAITLKGAPEAALSIPKIISLRISVPVLYDLLAEYGFSYAVVKDIYQSIESQSGKKFYSTRYILLKDRKTFIIKERKETSSAGNIIIHEHCSGIDYPVRLEFKKTRVDEGFVTPRSKETVALDYETLKFPMNLRRWKKGDYFYSLGMKGRKKLSDYFSDQKINRFAKEDVWLLTSGDDIVWIIGWQIDDRFKITPQTKEILIVKLKK
jgi:tRNA(Ile)-lysidine synthase